MSYLLEGIRAGLILALLVGPLVVLLLQFSIRQGTAAAFAAALGIWLSDMVFVLATHYGMGELGEVSDDPMFQQLVGSVGVVILITTSIIMWFRPPPDLDGERQVPNKRGLFGVFLQGFAINTFNPFTVGFWSVFTLTQVHERSLDDVSAWAIYGGIIGTIVLTDVVKILAARKLRNFLKPDVLLKAQRFGALLLGVFGVVLGIRIFW
ncbi:MAG: threonine/homoserine/homoserine lactone efflux protein [Neolewinella sp.]|jgi:threonine/homoserine/homoserine lactone efflux protein